MFLGIYIKFSRVSIHTYICICRNLVLVTLLTMVSAASVSIFKLYNNKFLYTKICVLVYTCMYICKIIFFFNMCTGRLLIHIFKYIYTSITVK